MRLTLLVLLLVSISSCLRREQFDLIHLNLNSEQLILGDSTKIQREEYFVIKGYNGMMDLRQQDKIDQIIYDYLLTNGINSEKYYNYNIVIFNYNSETESEEAMLNNGDLFGNGQAVAGRGEYVLMDYNWSKGEAVRVSYYKDGVLLPYTKLAFVHVH